MQASISRFLWSAFTLQLFCSSSTSPAVTAQQTVFLWTLNQTFTIYSSSSGVPLQDERRGLSIYPFDSNGSFNSTGLVFPCFVAANETSTHLLSSAIFALCMRPLNVAFFMSINSPFQGDAILWAANRGSPAHGASLSLSLRSNGDLILYSDGEIDRPVWSSGTAGKGVVRMEITENPANLKLVDLRNRTVWQSLDYPLDTLSVGQSLKVGMKLVSWASGTDATEGKFSLTVEPTYHLKLLYKMDNGNSSVEYLPYWAWLPSDIWIPDACRNPDVVSVPCLAQKFTANASQDYTASLSTHGFSVGLRINGTSYSQQTVLSSSLSEDSLQTSILRLDFDGGLRIYSITDKWIPVADLFDKDTCLLPTRCGSYGVCTSNGQCQCPVMKEDHASASFVPMNNSDLSEGCTLAQPLSPNCSVFMDPSVDFSLQMQPLEGGIDYFANQYSAPIAVEPPRLGNGVSNRTDQACTDLCLHNCSCFAAFWHVDSQLCFHAQQQIGSFRGALNKSNFKAYVKMSISLPPPPTMIPVDSPQRHSKVKAVELGIGVGVMGFLVVCVILSCLYCKGYINVHGILVRMKAERLDEHTHIFPDLPTRFSYKDLDAATNRFSHKLGKGGFGAVYLGTLPNGLRIAVKKLEGLRQGDKEFWSELVIMGGVHHYNLLQLMGFCSEGDQRLLVYTYMENGSLDQWLFNSSGSSCHAEELQQEGDCHVARLSWELRYSIAVGVARGLAYLHEGCRKHILHLDIKPQNILLDESFVAKVADFGLSRPMERDVSHVVTTMRGTPGYLAPEWLKEGGTVGVKCDVFSYGMLLMEIVSGRKNMDMKRSTTSYPEWAFSQLADMKSRDGSSGSVMTDTTQQWSIDALTDAKLNSREDRAQLERLIITAFMCVLEKPEWRPSMGMVVQMLEGHLTVSGIDLSTLRQGLTFVLGNDTSSTDLADFKQQLHDFFSLSGASATADDSFVHVSAR